MPENAPNRPRPNVSRETSARVPLPPAFSARDIQTLAAGHGIHLDDASAGLLAKYDTFLLKWQKAINLIGPATIEDRANRHFIDSVQLLKLLPSTDIRLVDIGSGAGFPGLVLAMIGVREVHLVESDIRKATFLREVSRETSGNVTIHDRRVEDTTIEGADVLTARALAPLVDLLGYMHDLHVPTGLFLKGAQAAAEIDKALKKWIFSVESHASLTDPEAQILKITGLKPKTAG